MNARGILLTSCAALALAVGGCGGDDSSDSADTGSSGSSGSGTAASKAQVDIKDFKFGPEAVKVKVGGKVNFTNADKAKHNAQTDDGADGAFNTDDLLEDDSKSITFDEPGTIAYYCIYHRFMTGTVEVTE